MIFRWIKWIFQRGRKKHVFWCPIFQFSHKFSKIISPWFQCFRTVLFARKREGGGSNLKDCTEFSALGPSTDLDLVGFAGEERRGSFLEEKLLIISCTPYNINQSTNQLSINQSINQCFRDVLVTVNKYWSVTDRIRRLVGPYGIIWFVFCKFT